VLARSISQLTFTTKVSATRWRFVLLFCLPETRLAQAAIAFEDLAALPADRFCTEGGEFVGSVRFVEGSVRYPQAPQAVHTLKKLAFVWDGADDDMRMR
jgi:hypothetical protein